MKNSVLLALMNESSRDFYSQEGMDKRGFSAIKISGLTVPILEKISRIMEIFGVNYWLDDEVRANPNAEYELWVSTERHSCLCAPEQTWGLRRVSPERIPVKTERRVIRRREV